MHTKQGMKTFCRRSSRQRCAKTKTNSKTYQKTKVQDRWFYETVPALTGPAMTVPALPDPALPDPALPDPALTVPTLTVPALTVPACTVPALTSTEPEIDEDWELYYPLWEIHKHPGAWDYYKLDSTQKLLRQRFGRK